MYVCYISRIVLEKNFSHFVIYTHTYNRTYFVQKRKEKLNKNLSVAFNKTYIKGGIAA